MTLTELQAYTPEARIAYAAYIGDIALVRAIIEDLAADRLEWTDGVIRGKRIAHPEPVHQLDRPDPVTFHDLDAAADRSFETVFGVRRLKNA